MPGRIISGRTLRSAVDLSVDVVVVGSGAGGSMAARDLARAGAKVVLLEAGGHHTYRDFNQREGEMLPLLFQDGGGQATTDGAVTVLQGRCVGGSTVHNTNLCKRAPAEVLERWVMEHGARGWSPAEMAVDYEAVERELGVRPMTEVDMNRNNQLLKEGVERLGWRGGLLSHNREGCVRSGFCELGCAYDAKQNALKILVPEAVLSGALVYADVHADRVLHRRDRVEGVAGHVLRADGGSGPPVRIRSRAVCLAGSAIGSAALALRSGVPDPCGLIGGGLRLHPGAAVLGLFDDPVRAWQGIPQSYECTEKLSFEEGARERAWIVAAFAHPGGFAAMLPGFGAPHAALMREYPRTAALAAMLHDETEGRVGIDRRGRARIRYALCAADQRALLSGLAACAEILLAAGARQVMVPLRKPLFARTTSALAPLLEHRYRPLDPLLTSVHPMGTLRIDADPGRGVVDAEGRHHHLRGLYVADGSLFPTSLGGPPQMTIYVAGRKVARALVRDLWQG